MSRLQQLRADATRNALIDAARALFSDRGYAASGTEQIVREAGVTRGALYHHFRDKRELFQAVFEQVEAEFAATARAQWSADADSWTNLVAGCNAFLDTCLQPDVRRIVLLDGPSVLGRDTWRSIEEQYALALIAGALRNAMREQILPRQPVAPLAHLLLAAVNEAGLLIAQSDDTANARKEVGAAFEALLGGLRATTAPSDRVRSRRS